MGWLNYYRLLERYGGDLRRASKEELREAAAWNPNTPGEARVLAERIYAEEQAKQLERLEKGGRQ